MISRAAFWTWLLFLVMASGCQASEPSAADRDFLRMPPRERDKAILQYAPERQIDLYLKVLIEQHPPDLGLADAVASNGAKIIPALTKRLVSDDREIAKMHLLDIFLRMKELAYYPIATDTKTMVLLEQQVAAMKDPQWQKISRDMLDQIKAE